MCHVLFIVEELLIPFNTLAESEKTTKFAPSHFFFFIISRVSPIGSASTVNVDAILAILNFLLRPSFITINANPMNGLYSLATVLVSS
jgi:hypothetical protein